MLSSAISISVALIRRSDKLASTWSNVMEAVMKERNKGPGSRRPSPDSANLAKEPVGTQASSREGGVAVPPPRSLGSRSRLLQKEETHSSLRKLFVSDIEQPPRKMLRSRTDLDAALTEQANSDVEVLPQTPPTRRSRRKRPSGGEPVVVEDIPRWTEQNPGWDKHWDQPLVYNRSRVDREDIPRLDEGQCLNDNIIDFGLRFLFDALDKRARLTGRVYLHSTHFHTKLTSNKTYKDKINYDGVKSWTSKVDLLSYDYVVVPVNEQFHWWLAIICNPGRLDPDAPRPSASLSTDKKNEPPPEEVSSDVELTGVVERGPLDSPRESTAADLSHLSIQSPRVARHLRNDVNGDRDQEAHVVSLVQDDAVEKIAAESTRKPAKRGRKSAGPPPKVYDPQETRIITLDSLGGGHSNSVTCLKYYLAAEFEHKRKKVIESLPKQLGMKATNIPEQDNFHDCGVYLLGYAQEFFKSPDEFVHCLLQRDLPAWTIRASERRRALRDTIMLEHKRLHGIDEPAGLEEPHSVLSMKATVMPRNQQGEIVDTTTTPTSSRPSSSGLKLPIKKLQAGQEHAESPDEAAPNPPDNGGPREAVAELSLEPSPNGTKLPGRLPSAESSSNEVSLLPPHDVKGSRSDAEPHVAENRPDSWQDSDGPVEFIPTLPVSSPPKAGSDSEDVTVSKYFEPKSPKVSDKKPTAKRDSSEDIKVVGVNKVVRRNRVATPDRRPNARRDSGDISEIATSAFFASKPPAPTQEKKPSVRERGAISLALVQSRIAPPQPASSPASRNQLQGQPRRGVPRVQAAELVREIPVDVDLTKEEPADVTYMEV
jgi:sentrin-specific protease 7